MKREPRITGKERFSHRKHPEIEGAHLHYESRGGQRRVIGMSIREGTGERAVRVLGREGYFPTRGLFGGSDPPAPINHGREYLGHAPSFAAADRMIGEQRVLRGLADLLR